MAATTIPTFDPAEVTSQESVRTLARDRTHNALAVIAAMMVVIGGVVLAIRWNDPLLGMHSFRQTQTAITSYWILRGSPWLAYHTPVFGAPWSIPFEFPMYQLLVASLVKSTGMPLDPAGRLISYLFLLATIFPVRSLARAYGLTDRDVLVFAILLLASPIYLYWGTTFLIETMALFFCVAFLAGIVQETRDSNITTIAQAALLGVAGALGKITTFAPFYLLAGVILLFHLADRARRRLPLGRSVAAAIATMLPAPLLFSIWDRFADAQKARNSIGRLTMSTAPMTHSWAFGTWSQLFSERMVFTLVRGITDTVGLLAIVLFTFLAILSRHYGLSRMRLILIAAALCGFLLPYFLFTNLHIVHDYYDTANAMFLIFGIAVLIGGFFSNGHARVGWVVLTMAVVSQLAWFHFYFAKDLIHRGDYRLTIANTIAANTDDNAVISIYSKDWSPVIPYYSRRRSIMEQTFAPRDEVLARARNILNPQGGYPVEAVVHCPSSMDNDRELVGLLAPQLAHLYKQQIGDCEVYLTNPPTSASSHTSTIVSLNRR
jgi:hypothetical protein